ncbi:diaminopimelate epimerase [Tindallia californiensis]|uniref:Diaminopimelate epimerase n=1 Tax=Tindallia californiensis TaxID=159292 RepID=A0A1H3NVF2_9FIRM|nr:diaminopimelate epimerase [Tindallia californiensis]SDY92814.1 diaminopimelate epimerase [Tindallia californiensis]
MNIPFTKMHGIGNDFILLKRQDVPDASWDQKLAKMICQRHFGIGADGMMIAEASETADMKMLYYNADGSQGEMCGNGIRCFAHYVIREELVPQKPVLHIETMLDIREVEVTHYESIGSVVKVYMGKPKIRNIEMMIEVDGEAIKLADLTIGVPHVVLLESDLNVSRVDRIGPKVEKMDIFPQGTNVNFVKVHNRKYVSVMTWERGAGHTLACGTGICSVCSVLHRKGMVEKRINVMAEGGQLTIEIDKENGVYMIGPSQMIARGNFMGKGLLNHD